MKRTFLCAAVFACIAAMPANAVSLLWQGELFIVSINNASACNAVDLQVGDFARFSFRPKSVPGNGASDLLSWVFPVSSGHLQPVGGVLDTATVATLRTVGNSSTFAQLVNSPISATVTPAAPTAANSVISMTITMNNMYSSSAAVAGLSGCHPTFSGLLLKRP